MTRPALRSRLLIGASATALLVIAGGASAQSLFRKSRSANPAEQAAAAAAQRATQNQAASTATRRTIEAFSRASAIRQRMDAAQVAARAAAQAAQISVPNGLGKGGLQVANGVATDPSLWIGATGPTQATGSDGRTKVEVGQTESKAILTWNSFNVGRETDLNFNQKGNANWVALNRVTDPSADPSRILGSIKADGSVYIINRNGIVFGGAAQVNVRSLIASSLDIHGGAIESSRPLDTNGVEVSDSLWQQAKIAARDQRFKDGILSADIGIQVPATFGDGQNYAGIDPLSSPNPIVLPDETFAEGDGVTVQAGAVIQTAPFGSAVLLGHNVVNEGRISATDGQVLLAAGRSILLRDGTKRQAPPNGGVLNPPQPPVAGYIASIRRGGAVRNDGIVESARGNIGLVGKAITQAGLATATTSIDKRGSIIVDATDGVGFNGETWLLNGDQVGAGYYAGTARFAEGSLTAILPDTEGGRTAIGNPFQPSFVEVIGNQILLDRDATIWAPGGNVRLIASGLRPEFGVVGRNLTPGRIYLEEGAVLDVAGLAGVELDMSANSVEAQLRANELADNPVLRDGVLRGETVYFDARFGDKLKDGTGVANLAGWYDLIPHGVEEFMTVGGAITVRGPEIIAREGSTIDVSGGSVRYRDGTVRQTRLIDASGRLVPIEAAQAGVKYVGLEGDLIVNHARWGITERYRSPFARNGAGRFQSGYDEGRSAGLLDIQVGSITLNDINAVIHQDETARIFDGTVKAGIVQGDYQVDAPTGAGITDQTRIWHERPTQGTLTVSNTTDLGSFVAVPGGNITIADSGPRLGSDFSADSVLFDYANGVSSLVPGIDAHNHVLPSRWFDGENFGKVSIASGDGVAQTHVFDADGAIVAKPGAPAPTGVLTIGKGVTVDLGDYGSFGFIGRQALIDGTIVAPGGSVTIETGLRPKLTADSREPWADIPDALRPGTWLGDGAAIDVAGRWTNGYRDYREGTRTRPLVDGGDVTLAGYQISLAKGSLIDVGGGAHLSTDGATLTLGNGGNIVLDTDASAIVGAVSGGALVMDGTLSGHAPGKGGTLTIDTPRNVYVGATPVSDEDGILAKGEAAPFGTTLSEALTIAAGSPLPIEKPYNIINIIRLEAGVPVVNDTPYPPVENVVTAADWVVPQGVDVVSNSDYTNQYQTGQTVPAGTKLAYIFGQVLAGNALPADVFPDGLFVSREVIPAIHPVGTVLDVPTTYADGVAVPGGTVFANDVAVVASLRYDANFFTKGGFSGFALSGARGMTIQSGTVIAPTVDTIVLGGGYADIASGASLRQLIGAPGSAVSLQNSRDLPAWQRPATDLVLATVPSQIGDDGAYIKDRISSDPTPLVGITYHPGVLTMEKGADIRMAAGSRVLLNSSKRLFIDGSIETPGGQILIAPVPSSGGTVETVIGDDARLLARGYQVDGNFVRGVEQRRVEAGGLIQLGSLIRGEAAIQIGTGALLDVSGVAGFADLPAGDSPVRLDAGPPLVPVAVDGAAGSITIAANVGLIAGQMNLSPGGETGRGGTLAITAGGALVRRTIGADVGATGVDAEIPLDGLTLFGDAINASGADNLALTASSLNFAGDVSLSARRSILLSGNSFNGLPGDDGAPARVDIASDYVRLTGPSFQSSVPAGGIGEGSSLTVDAGLIDVTGLVAFANANLPTGFDTVRLNADGDIRLLGDRKTSGEFDQVRAGLFAPGDLTFNAAQVYVSTLSADGSGVDFDQYDRLENDPGFLVEAGRSITNRSNGQAARVPFTFGERMTWRAPVITQAGVVRSPQGQIILDASEKLTLAPGSLTSASMEGITALAGEVTGTGNFAGYARADWAPTKAVMLSGADVDVQAGATVDLSGGGDLLAWAFQPGVGGTRNILADYSDTGAFAILPGYDGPLPTPAKGSAQLQTAGWNAPVNVLTNAGGGTSDPRLRIGDRIWLESAPGLTAGYYTLLPAAYAQLAGGMLVKPSGGSTASAIKPLPFDDGSTLVGGYRAVADTPIRDPWSTFTVLNEATWRQYSTITPYLFNKTKAAAAADAGFFVRTVSDAGALVAQAERTLSLGGTTRLTATDGLAGDLDIASRGGGIAVVSGGAAPEGYLAVDAAQLAATGAGSILIGGRRPVSSRVPSGFESISPPLSGTTVATLASDVLIADGVDLNAAELLLTATGTVTVGDGARLTATGSGKTNPNDLLLSGDGALLRLSSGDRVGLIRTGSTGASGSLAIGSGAVLTTDGALSLDASAGFDLAADAVLDVTKLDLASNRINLGDTPVGEAGTTIGRETIERLASSSDLLLRGYDSIHLFGDFALGSRGADGTAALGALSFDTASLVGHAGAGAGARLTAGVLTLTNSGGGTAADYPTGTGRLTLDVDTLALGPGMTGIGGYATVAGTIGTIATTGDGGLAITGDADVKVGNIVAGSGSDFALSATGNLALRSGTAPVADAATPLGGRISLTGAGVSFDTVVLVRAGGLSLSAESGNLLLGGNARIDASGAAVDFVDVTKFAPGGSIRLAAAGDVLTDTASVIDVSGHERGGAAGVIAVDAGGRAALAGELRAASADGYAGGEFALDAGTTDFADLNTRLNAGGFTAARDIRLRDQDIVLAAGDRIDAHRVTLQSNGLVRIAGTIAAGGDALTTDGGVVRLLGGNVLLDATGRIEAAAGQAGAQGFAPSSGSVELAATSGGRVTLAAGSTIDLSGGREGGGRIMVRADRDGAGVAADLNGTVTGARERTLVGMAGYDAETVDAGLVDTMTGDAATWLASATPVAGWNVGAGMQVTSANDLTITDTIDLAGIDGAGWLGLTAGGDLRIDAAISDGFTGAAKTDALESGRSFGYDLAAGQDVIVGAGRIVRTGTGDIRVAAGRDLVFVDNGSSIYTAGATTATAPGFDRTGYTLTKENEFSRVLGEFPTLGGGLILSAGRDITAPIVNQTSSAWLFRYGQVAWNGVVGDTRTTEQTSWSILYRNFGWAAGALGGGDVRVRAGGDVRDLSLAMPSTGHLTTLIGSRPRAADLVVRGGGNLDVRTGGDLLGGAFALGLGHATLRIGGDAGGGAVTDVFDQQPFSFGAPIDRRGLNPQFGLMDATIDLSGGGTVDVEAVYDLTQSPQICENVVGACTTPPDGTTFGQGLGSAFVGYTDRSAFDAIAAGGDFVYRANGFASVGVTYANPDAAFQVKPGRIFDTFSPTNYAGLLARMPGTTKFTSLGGDAIFRPTNFGNQPIVSAAPRGTFEMLAAGSITVDRSRAEDAFAPFSFTIQDVGSAYVRNALAPARATDVSAAYVDDVEFSSASNNYYRGFVPLHAGDTDPVRFVALDGSIGPSNPAAISRNGFVILAPKPVAIYASDDVRFTGVTAQNNGPKDASTIIAGGDIVVSAQFSGTPITVYGPGTLWIEAGGNLGLPLDGFGGSSAITSVGNGSGSGSGSAINLALADVGADIHLIAGTAQGADANGFAARYLDPANRADPAFGLSHPSNVGKVVRTYEDELDAFLTSAGFTEVTPDNRLALFETLPGITQRGFLQHILLTELRETGIDYNETDGPRFQQYTRGYSALATLFPATADLNSAVNPAGGDILLNDAQIESQSGGAINILAPYGRIGIGNPLGVRPDLNAGVITRRGGEINILANGTISLDLSRVFTLQGGDLLMWTSNGDITAGAGAKTNVSAVPLSYAIDRFGQLGINTFGLQTGAGIGVLDAFEGRDPSRRPSRLDLLAFFGEVNAGDAGIRVVGDLNIAALSVVNAANIEVSGEATGIPVTAQVNTGALTAASAATGAIANEAARLAERTRPNPVQDIPTILNVRFVGFGEE